MTSPTPSPSRRAALLTAALSVVMLGVLAALVHAVLLDTRRGSTLSPEARLIEEELAAAGNPDVIVLGNSCADASLDIGMLASALDTPVVKVWVPGSKAPTWYAALKNRVYGNGHKPRLILVPTMLGQALATRPDNANETKQLLKQMGESDPIIEAKALSGGDASWSPLSYRAQRNAERLRDALLYQVPKMGIGMASRMRGGDFERGALRTQRAMTRVFALDDMLPERLIVPGESPVASKLALPPIEQSMISDLVELAHANGSDIVFVRLPPAPGHEQIDPVDFRTEYRFVQYLNELGAGFYDAQKLRLGQDDYMDYIHLDRSGRERLTSAVVSRIEAWGGLDALEARASTLPVSPPVVVRTGNPGPVVDLPTTRTSHPTCTHEVEHPLFARLSARVMRSLEYDHLPMPMWLVQDGRQLIPNAGPDNQCKPGEYIARGSRVRFRPHERGPAESVELRPADGAFNDDARLIWVYPGTTTELRFETAFKASGLVVDVHAQPFPTTANGPEPTVTLGNGEPVPLEGFGGRLNARIEREQAPLGEWSLFLDNPPEGPLLALHAVEVGPNPRRLATVHALRGVTTEPIVEVIGLPLPEVEIAWPPDYTEPVPDRLTHPPLRSGPGRGVGVVSIPELSFLAGACSPVVLYEDGQLFRNQFNVVRRVHKCPTVSSMPGSSCHGGDELWFSTVDGHDPSTDGRSYSVRLRRMPGLTPLCSGRFWVFPGDDITVDVDNGRLRALHRGANLLTLTGIATSRRPSPHSIHVTVFADGQVAGQREIPVSALPADAAAVPLRMIPPTARDVSVQIHNPPGNTYVQLFKATLAEASDNELDEMRSRSRAFERQHGGR